MPFTSSTDFEKIESPMPVSGNGEPSGLVNSLTGLLSKAADTYIDIWGLQTKNKIIGSQYPTGQTDPAKLKSTQQAAASTAFNWKPWAIGGLVAAVLIVGVVAVSRRK